MHTNSQNPLARIFRLALALVALTALVACTARQGGAPYYAAGPVENQLMAEIALQRGEYLVSVQQYLSLAQKSADPDVARRATELAYEYGYDAYALAAAERWVKLSPADTAPHFYLGRLYAARNLPEQAWTSLNIALGPPEQRTDEDYLLLSEDLSNRADAAVGASLFERFNTEYPDSAGITGSLAGMAADAGQLDVAISAARETVVLAPEWTGARVWLARFLLAADERSSAFEQMAFAVEMQPGLEMELEFVSLLAAAGEYDDAIERLTRLEERFPGNPDLRRTRAIVLLQTDDVPGATAEFTRLLSEAYFVDECFWYLGQIALQANDFPQAIRYFERITSESWLLRAQQGISQAYLALGEPESALQTQQDFAAAYPKRAFDTLSMQADLLIQMGRRDEALQIIETSLEYKPWNATLWLYRGAVYEEAGQFDQAIKAFSKAVEFSPDNATALNALGYTLTIATRRYKDAEDYISRALEFEPDNPAIMDSMGWVLFKQNQLAESRVWLERALALLPDPEVAAHLGEVLWQQGDKDAAIKIWTTSLQSNPDDVYLNATIKRFIP